MLRLVLLLAALVLLALGALGLYTADRDSSTDFVIAGVELIAGLALIGIALVIHPRDAAETAASPGDGRDRTELLERLQRHTLGFPPMDEHDSAHAPSPERQEPERRSGSADVEPHDPDTAPTARQEGDSPWVGRQPPPEPIVYAEPEREAASGNTSDGAKGGGASVRLPPIMLLNVTGDAGPADIESAPPLGTKESVVARLRGIVPDLEIDATGRTELSGPDHALRLDLGTVEPVHTVVIEAAGRTGISLVRWLLESTGWRAFVPKSGRFVEPDALDSIAVLDAAE